jgi:hypothetical protein
MRIRDPGWKKFGSGMEKKSDPVFKKVGSGIRDGKIRIRVKHPGSATLISGKDLIEISEFCKFSSDSPKNTEPVFL